MKNDSQNDSSRVDLIVKGYSGAITLNTKLLNLLHAVMFSYTRQTSQDRNSLRPQSDVKSENISSSITTMISDALTVTPSLSINITDSEAIGKMTTSNAGLTVGSRLYHNKIANTLGGNYTSSKTISIVSVTNQMSFGITSADNLRFTMTYSKFDDRSTLDQDYSESTANVNLTHRF
jgi:hypothetical protein